MVKTQVVFHEAVFVVGEADTPGKRSLTIQEELNAVHCRPSRVRMVCMWADEDQ